MMNDHKSNALNWIPLSKLFGKVGLFVCLMSVFELVLFIFVF